MRPSVSPRRAAGAGVAAILALGLAGQADAQEAAAGDAGWSFALTPYVWGASLKGDAGVIPGLPVASVDASFSDIIDNADFAFMIAGEARRGRFAIVGDLSYLSLSADATTPGPLFGGASLDSKTFFATVAGMYRVHADERLSLDLGAGARIWYVDNEIDLRAGLLPARRVQDDETWVDPLIGARGTIRLGHGFSLSAAGDIGGFGVSSDLTWQVLGTLDYRFTDWLSVRAGYRHLEVDYDRGGFVWDVRMSGPIVGATFRF
jgi:hypothetical protein